MQRLDGLGIAVMRELRPESICVPALAAFFRRSSSGSMPIFCASMSSTLSTAKAAIGEPGAR